MSEPIVSTIYSINAKRSILWGGPAAGIMGIHRWTFDAVDAGTHVTTEESWAGVPIEAEPSRSEEDAPSVAGALAGLSRQRSNILMLPFARSS